MASSDPSAISSNRVDSRPPEQADCMSLTMDSSTIMFFGTVPEALITSYLVQAWGWGGGGEGGISE